MYLIPSDYEFQIRQEIKALLKGQSPTKLERAETAAVGQMVSYLNRRYDTAKIFPFIATFQVSIPCKATKLYAYKETSQTEDEWVIYECLADSTNQLPTDATYFKPFTARYYFVLMYLVDITIYHLHSASSQRLITEIRVTRYDEALEWLKAVGAGELDADLPPKQPEDTTYVSDIRFGSLPKESHQY